MRFQREFDKDKYTVGSVRRLGPFLGLQNLNCNIFYIFIFLFIYLLFFCLFFLGGGWWGLGVGGGDMIELWIYLGASQNCTILGSYF